MKIYLILIAVSLLFVCCSSHDDDEIVPSENPSKAELTVLIYMAADNNLYLTSNNDLNEIKEGSKSLNEAQNLLVYVDDSLPSPPYIARVKDGQFVDSVSMEESFSADPQILEKMVRYAHQNYPAESYGLILWGHCNGWIITNDTVSSRKKAYGLNTNEKEGENYYKYWMNIPSMAKAISSGMEGERLKFIFGDCCTFADIETMYELRNNADYLIGSPAEVPERGAPYQLVVPQLFSKDELFLKNVIDIYFNYYKDLYVNDEMSGYIYFNKNFGDLEGYSLPLVVIKTSELEELAQATAKLLSTIPDKLTPDGTFLLEGMPYYDATSNERYSYDIIPPLKANTSETDFNIWLKSFRKAVLYANISTRWYSGVLKLRKEINNFDDNPDNYGAMGMFFPSHDYDATVPNWNKAIRQMEWNNVIRWEQYGW